MLRSNFIRVALGVAGAGAAAAWATKRNAEDSLTTIMCSSAATSLLKRTLQEENFNASCSGVVRKVVRSVTGDEEIKAGSKKLLAGLFESEEVYGALRSLVLSTLKSSEFRAAVTDELSDVSVETFATDEIRATMRKQMCAIIEDRETKDRLARALARALGEKETRSESERFLKKVVELGGGGQERTEKSVSLFTRNLIKETVTDMKIKDKSENCVWSSLKYAVMPSCFQPKC